MIRLSDYVGRVGTIRRGEYSGLEVSVEKDPTEAGWHVFVHGGGSSRLPGDLPGLDLWADDEKDAWEWLRDEFGVEWSDKYADPVLLPNLETPIFVERRGDVVFFPTLSAAERYLAPGEAQNGKYRLFDASGNILKVVDSLSGVSQRWLFLKPTTPAVEELAEILRAYLGRAAPASPGELSAGLADATLPQLIERMATLSEQSGCIQRSIRKWRTKLPHRLSGR